MERKLFGHIMSGSLSEGLIMRVNPLLLFSELKTGKFVAIESIDGLLFSLLADLRLQTSNPDIMLFPPDEHETLLQDFLRVKDIYATALLRPLLALSAHKKPMPVKTIPHHFAPVYEAHTDDISCIFGSEEEPNKRFFRIGSPLDMDAGVCIDLDKLTERSTGIFGKTGTGKTFLTRLLLAGLIYNDKAVTLIFDMHSEYGIQARKESAHNSSAHNSFVKGLKTLFPHKVAIFSLDPESTRRRGSSPDVCITLSYQSVAVEDIISLNQELNLHATACEAAYLLAAKFKRNWLLELLKNGDTIKELAQEIGAHPESLAALYRKVRAIERLPFFTHDYGSQKDVIDTMIDYLDRNISLIIEFGNYTSSFCYLLLANIITRRIHARYTQKTERFLGTQQAQDEPKKLVIVIEEAHKFLNTHAARQTIFGIIAREMRKYYVSLLVVDQRPSGIDDEIVSQLGTKIIAQLNDEKDIQAVLTGVANATYLRTILAALESKKQVVALGHAIAMPIVIETRAYDEELYKSVTLIEKKSLDQFINQLF